MSFSFKRAGKQQSIHSTASGNHPVLARVCMEVLEERRMLNAAPILNLQDFSTWKFPADNRSAKPVIIPLSAIDDDGDALKYTVSSSNKNIKVSLEKNLTFIKFTVSHQPNGTDDVTITNGEMVFALLGNITPNTVKIIKGLVEGEYYDGLKLHRVTNLQDSSDPTASIIQGGDQAGTGSGQAPFQFEDEFNSKKPGLFTGKGQLAMANGGADTNGTQFFITTQPQRFLDFKHTVFGQLVQGWETLDKLASVKRANETPLSAITISKVEIIEDKTDAVAVVRAPWGEKGTITVKVSDGQDVDQQSFQVRGAPDMVSDGTEDGRKKANERPFFLPINDFTSAMNAPIYVRLKYFDWDRDRVTFSGSFSGATHGIYQIEGDLLTIYPEVGYKGPITFTVSLQSANDSSQGTDSETFVVGVGAQPLAAGKGMKVQNTTGNSKKTMRVATFRSSDPQAKASDFLAQINWGDSQVSSGKIKALGKGLFAVTGTNPYRAEGDYAITVNLSSKVGASQKIYTTASISDAPVTIKPMTLAGTAPKAFGDAVVATFKDSDPRGKLEDFTATIDWGDGLITPGIIAKTAEGEYKVTVPTEDENLRTFSSAGNYNVIVTIKDKGGKNTKATIKTHVGRDTLQVDAVSAGSINEGQDFVGSGTFTDSVATTGWSAKVDYGEGDGFVDLPLNGQAFSLNHKYANSGSYKITVLVTVNGVTSSDTIDLTVRNVAPTAAVTGISSGVRGQTRTVNLSANDASKADKDAGFTYTIDWGDGSTATTTSTIKGDGTATHVFATSGTYYVKVKAKDKDSATSEEHTIVMTIKDADLQADPDDPSKLNLVVGGTNNKDTIAIDSTADGKVSVKFGDNEAQVFAPTGRVIVFGGEGNDMISASASFSRDLEIYGGDGNDKITGGAGNDIILGGPKVDSDSDPDDDSLVGGAGRDLIIGGGYVNGAKGDTISGGDGEDLLISGSTDFDSDSQKLQAIMKEWTYSKRTYTQRFNNLRGITKGGLNGDTLLDYNTVSANYTTDRIKGEGGQDVFFGSPNSFFGGKDTIADKGRTESLIEI